ncbi:gamma-butyrobetaine hydroxylase-like domain-containing protein [Pseudomonas nicosulfuronedens]
MNIPIALHRSSADSELRIHWDDSVEQCIELVPAGVILQVLNLQGYGVQRAFDDGHDHGIFPWEYLRGLR